MRSLPLATMAVETAEQVQQPDPCSEPPRADLASTAGEVSFLEPSHQSAWNAYDHSNLAPQVELQSTIAGNLLEAAEEREIIQLPQGSPQGTPPPAECPVASFGLKSFSRFNTPSPQRRASRKSYSRRSTGQLRGILSNNTPRRATLGTKRRVTFAALPGGVEEEQEGGVSGELILRPTSPPPRASAAMGDEDISGHFQKHFESMKRNKSRRLGPDRACALPSLSDNTIPGQADVPAPEVAEQLTSSAACGPPATPDRSDDAKAATNADIYDPAALQSPWRQDTQSEMIDDVAAVMGNLDAFLDAWSMEHEVQKASQPVDQENSRGRDQSKGKSPGIRSGLQELSMWN
ncbi:hypothetical protein Micbo1qcDRAFT_168114 [Microdochium bolleyi]|uniref:Uncharacterized protein n=1 Tax=Microdochium bolleyi TaxID=196109 RepID=A0A136INY8_9PEZI|nr:hypothetical protein Micbo1qcDRAFT_168114 [Microdochium bolleyi]